MLVVPAVAGQVLTHGVLQFLASPTAPGLVVADFEQQPFDSPTAPGAVWLAVQVLAQAADFSAQQAFSEPTAPAATGESDFGVVLQPTRAAVSVQAASRANRFIGSSPGRRSGRRFGFIHKRSDGHPPTPRTTEGSEGNRGVYG